MQQQEESEISEHPSDDDAIKDLMITPLTLQQDEDLWETYESNNIDEIMNYNEEPPKISKTKKKKYPSRRVSSSQRRRGAFFDMCTAFSARFLLFNFCVKK